jgi:Flp pilus assembly protein TadD
VCLIALVAAGLAPAAPGGRGMDLRFDRLASALTLLNDSDRRIVDEAAELIREGENVGALARLSALTRTNPENSSLRILLAYAQLQIGNLTGAFDEAKKAESAPNGNSYKCFFLAKLALLAGDKATCRREIEHVKGAGDMKEEVRQLQGEMKKTKGKG